VAPTQQTCLLQARNFTMDCAQGRIEAARKISQAVLTPGIEQERREYVSLQPGPEDGQQGRRDASHNLKISSV
jgi:hypothetical protein